MTFRLSCKDKIQPILLLNVFVSILNDKKPPALASIGAKMIQEPNEISTRGSRMGIFVQCLGCLIGRKFSSTFYDLGCFQTYTIW